MDMVLKLFGPFIATEVWNLSVLKLEYLGIEFYN